jgi:integrase
VLWTAITTGARPGEVSALRENRFDFGRQQVRVSANYIVKRGNRIEKAPKDGEGRVLSLDLLTCELLRERFQRRRAEARPGADLGILRVRERSSLPRMYVLLKVIAKGRFRVIGVDSQVSARRARIAWPHGGCRLLLRPVSGSVHAGPVPPGVTRPVS